MKKRLAAKLNGISLLEVLLSLAIIAIILVLATRYFNLAENYSRVNQTLTTIENINAAAARWRMSHSDFSNISLENLIARGLLPSGAENNPWGGNNEVQSANNNSQYTIFIRKLPEVICRNLLEKLNSNQESTPPGTCSGGGSLVDLERTFGP